MSEIIPAIDLRGGRCVRLIQGDPAQETVYGDDPVAQARAWAAQGATRLHVVDLDGAFEGAQGNRAVIERICAALDIPVQVGGGVRDVETAAALLGGGVERVILGTAAVTDPSLVAALCGAHPGRVALGVDTRDGVVAVEGWTAGSTVSAAELIGRYATLDIAAVIYTDIATDGMLGGPNLEALRAVAAESPFPVIASGGISTVEHVRAVAALGVAGMIIGKALYTGDLSLPALVAADLD